tara:strand:+ start:624 stop:830 length:207 start_codon:yes stop_codon:yes gene_type:complete
MSFTYTIEFFEWTDALKSVDLDGDYLERLELAQETLNAARTADIAEYNNSMAIFIISHHYGIVETDLV